MKTPAGNECPYFYGDYFRGRKQEECRLLTGTNPDKRWQASLCETCPVPAIAQANACEHQQLHALVARKFFGLRKEVDVKAYCTRCECDVRDPHVGCGQCHPNIPNFQIGE